MKTSVLFRHIDQATREAVDRYKAEHRVKTDSGAAADMLLQFHGLADRLATKEQHLYRLQQELDRFLDATREVDSAERHLTRCRVDLAATLKDTRRDERSN